MQKYHRLYQSHDEWYPDRKNKTLGMQNGGMAGINLKESKFMTLQPSQIPRGCVREIKKYQTCSKNKGKDECMNERISIMEVCPEHVLEGLRERRKWYLRAETIDNATYKRAMTVSDYNKNRSVSDLDIKDWSYGHPKNMRSDSVWQDDRYDPIKYPHPHRYDNVNFPEQEYTDVFGGTLGTTEQKEREKHQIGLFSGNSTAMIEKEAQKRKDSLASAAKAIDAINATHQINKSHGGGKHH
jgi:hypothetical protein